MDERRSFSADMFGMVVVAAILAVMMAWAVQPLSNRLAAFVSRSLMGYPGCASPSPNNTANLVCLFRR